MSMTGGSIGSALVVLGLALGAAVPGTGARPETDPGIVAAAANEGKVVIYSTTDLAVVQELLRAFRACYPKVEVEYHDMNSSEIYARFMAEQGAGGGSADLLWSSAMDLQLKLANDGYALEYDSPAAAKVPAWAVWKNEAFGTTFEPIGFAYNKRLLRPEEVPQSHGELVRAVLAAPDRWAGKIASYDPQRSGIGFLLITQDAMTDPAFPETLRAYGVARLGRYASTGAMLDEIQSGKHLLGVNVIGSYALAKARTDPGIGFVIPRDYALVMSRIALIPKAARHPYAGRLFLDFLLSERGQEIIAQQANLFAIRGGVPGEYTAAHLRGIAGEALRPITVGPSLLVYLDQAKRVEFLRRWERTVVGGGRKRTPRAAGPAAP